MPTMLAEAPSMFRGAPIDEEATPSQAAKRLYWGGLRLEETLTPPAASTALLPVPATPIEQVARDLRTRAPAVAAVEDIRRWLSLSYDDVANLIECAPSSVYYWKQRASEGRVVRPQAATVTRLFQIHSLLRSISIALGSDNDAGAVHAWVSSRSDDHPETPLDLLQSGRFEEAYRRASNVVFDRRPPAPRAGASYAADPGGAAPMPAPLPTEIQFDGLVTEDDEFE